MNPVMARSSNMSSKRHFHWTNKVGTEDGEVHTSESFSTLIQKEDKKEADKVVDPEVSSVATASAHATRRKLRAVTTTLILYLHSTYCPEIYKPYSIQPLFSSHH